MRPLDPMAHNNPLRDERRGLLLIDIFNENQ